MMFASLPGNMRVWRTTVALAAFTLAMASSPARAADDAPAPDADPAPRSLAPTTGDEDAYDDFATFMLVKRHDKHYLRAGLEVGAVLAVGLVDYLLNTSARGGTMKATDARWDLRYDWPTLRGKLTGEDIALDSNKFNTNYVSHPFAGTLYYSVARSNHLSFAESFLYAVLGSTTWEYFGEIRETTSVNDLVVTPVSGAAIGEATMQMAAFFDRGEKRFSNDLLSFLFSPLKTVNEALDDAHPLRTAHPDDLGFATEPWHRFTLSAGAGVTSPSAAGPGHPRASYLDERFDVDMQLANLPDYARAGRRSRLFDDGNVASVRFGASLSGGEVVDAQFATRTVPVGYYLRDAALDDRGRVRGHGALLGLRIGFEYGTHTWDRDHAFARPNDVIAIASPIGLAAEHTYDEGALRIRTSIDLYGGIAGVTPYALGEYRSNRPLDGMPTTLRQAGYYHGVSISAVPGLELSSRELSLSGHFRVDSFRALEGVDEDPSSVDRSLGLSDVRTEAEATFAFRPAGTRARLAVSGLRRSRIGDAGPVHASRIEIGALGTVGVVF
jgi:hypothetical protein